MRPAGRSLATPAVDRLKVAHLSLEGLNHNIKSQQPRLVNSSPSANELGAGNSNVIPTKPSLPTSTITCSSEDNMPTDTAHCIYIRHCTFDFLLLFRFCFACFTFTTSLLFSFYFLCGEDCSDPATLVGDCF